MPLQYLAVQLLVILFWIDLCVGQIVIEAPQNSSDSSCTTPDGKRGNCRRWTQCEILNKKIDHWDMLKPYVMPCGFAGNEPIVCCPTVSRAANTAIANGPRINPSRSPANSNEKRIFLPEDCGSSIFTHSHIILEKESEKGSWPWMAVIMYVRRNSTINICGGTLVTARHVVTAAHCVVKQRSNTPMESKQLMVRVGVHDLSNGNDPGAMDVQVDAVRIHELYDLRNRTDDIAVLRLSHPVPFSTNTAPVCLPYNNLRYEDLTGKSSTVTGFGLTSFNGSYSDVLLEVSFDIQDQEMCRRTYADELRIIDGHLCAGTLDGTKDSCQGDSGGPLVTTGNDKRYYLVGIVSFVKMCAVVGYPGVYTRVSEYLDWLESRLAD